MRRCGSGSSRGIDGIDKEQSVSRKIGEEYGEYEEYGENVIMLEMQKGYQYKDKVIRHSMVKVAN